MSGSECDPAPSAAPSEALRAVRQNMVEPVGIEPTT